MSENVHPITEVPPSAAEKRAARIEKAKKLAMAAAAVAAAVFVVKKFRDNVDVSIETDTTVKVETTDDTNN